MVCKSELTSTIEKQGLQTSTLPADEQLDERQSRFISALSKAVCMFPFLMLIFFYSDWTAYVQASAVRIRHEMSHHIEIWCKNKPVVVDTGIGFQPKSRSCDANRRRLKTRDPDAVKMSNKMLHKSSFPNWNKAVNGWRTWTLKRTHFHDIIGALSCHEPPLSPLIGCMSTEVFLIKWIWLIGVVMCCVTCRDLSSSFQSCWIFFFWQQSNE